MHLSDDELWHLSPIEFNALVERYEEEQERRDFRAGLICSVLANIYRDTKKRQKAYTPQDFMPQKQPEPKQEKKQENIVSKEQLQFVSQIFGGEVK